MNNSNNNLNEKIDELIGLIKENTVIVRKVRRGQQIAQLTRVFYWVVIIGLGFGSFYFLQPYLGGLLNLYTGGTGVGTGGIPDVNHLKSLIELYK